MHKNKNTAVLLLLIAFAFSCQKEPAIISPKNNWTQLLTDYHYNGDEIYVLGKVEQNELRLLNLTGVFVIDGTGQLYHNEGLLLGIEIPLGIKPTENRSFLTIFDQRGSRIEFFDYTAYDHFGNYDSYEIVPGFPTHNYGFLKDITNFNPGKEVGALNVDDGFLMPIVRAGFENRINLYFFTMLGSFLREPQSGNFIHPDSTNYHKIVLPDEGTTVVNRVQSFNENFLVSTAHFSYVVRPDGTFKQIFNKSVQEFFTWKNLEYADFGDAVYASSDDGETWNLVKDHLTNNGFRQFFSIKDSLCFFRNDSMFLVHKDWSAKQLNNIGFQGDEITSVSEFIDNVYVTTLSGLFYKPRENFFK